VSVLVGRQIGIESGLAMDQARGERRELVVELVGIDGVSGRWAGCRGWCRRAADR
jgi:hypothetical protein